MPDKFRRLLFLFLAAFCLGEVLHCAWDGELLCAGTGCAVHCCKGARVAQPKAEMAEPDFEPEYRAASPAAAIPSPLPEDIFHPPAA